MSFQAMILILFNLSLVPVLSVEGFLNVKYDAPWKKDMGVAKVSITNYYWCKGDDIDLGQWTPSGCGVFYTQECRACAPKSEIAKITGPHSSCWYDEKTNSIKGRNRAGMCDELNDSGYLHVYQGCVYGANIKLYRNMKVEECMKLCDETPECLAFEYGVAHGGRFNMYKPGDCQLQSSYDFDQCPGNDYNLDLYIRNGDWDAVVMDKGANKCSSSTNKIHKELECKMAARTLGLRWNKVVDLDRVPGGCYTSSDWVSFNKHSGKGNKNDAPVCKSAGTTNPELPASCALYEQDTGLKCWDVLINGVLDKERKCRGPKCEPIDGATCCRTIPVTCLKGGECCAWGSQCFGCPNGNEYVSIWSCWTSRRCKSTVLPTCPKRPGECCIAGSDCWGCPFGTEHCLPGVCGSSRRCSDAPSDWNRY